MADLTDNLGELNTTTAGLALAMKGVTAAIKGLKSGLDFFDKNQREALKVGSNTATVQARLGDSINQLNGSIDRRLTTSITTLGAGLDGNILGVNRLINEQNILGQNFKRTASIFGKLEATAGLNNFQLGVLGENLLATSKAYGISTEALVDSIDGLSDNFTQLSVRGVAGPFADAVSQLTAQFGVNFQQPLQRIVGLLTGADLGNLPELAALGITGIFDRVDSIKTTEDAMNLLLNSITIAGNRFDQLSKESGIGIAGITGAVGKAGLDFSILNRQISEGLNSATNNLDDTSTMFSTALEAVLNPLKNIFIQAAPALANLAKQLNEQVKALTESKTLDEALKTVSIKIVEFIEFFGNGLYRLLRFVDGLIPGEGLGIIKGYEKPFRDIEKIYTEREGGLAGGFTSLEESFKYRGGIEEAIKFDEKLRTAFETNNITAQEFKEWRNDSRKFLDLSDLKETIRTGLVTPAEETARNTKDLVDLQKETQSEFLSATDDIMQRTIGAVLGYTPAGSNPFDYLADVMSQVEENTRNSSFVVGIGEQ